MRRNTDPGGFPPDEASPRPVVAIGGPTASGKSALAAAIAEAFGGTIVNADSMQLYRDLHVLSARPDPAEEKRLPHRLYGVLDGTEHGSVGRWLALARQTVAALGGSGPAVLVGGTGLYLKAAMEGLTRLPAVPAAVRAAADAQLERIGTAAFHAELALRDPEAGRRLAPADRQRLVRAWSMIEATGRSLFDWQRSAPDDPPLAARLLPLILLPPREALYGACDRRFADMVEAGAIAEVEALRARDIPPSAPVMKAVGVREIGAYLDGEIDREEMIERGCQATRRYAKRQYTWFRNQMRQAPGVTIVSEQFSQSLTEEIFPKIRHFLLTASG